MFESILKCKKCKLCQNQKPLLDNKNKCDIMWIGLSAKQVNDIIKDIPLDSKTNSGKIIYEIECKCKGISFYKTNLVKCLPLENNKLRYPDKKEMDNCINNLLLEINYLKPKKIFLLGNKVSSYLKLYIKNNNIMFDKNTKIYTIYHPSYIYVYKRKNIEEYINDVIYKIKE